MKKPITLRVDVELLAEARRCAHEENRTLTNFIETTLRNRLALASRLLPAPARATKRIKDKAIHAA